MHDCLVSINNLIIHTYGRYKFVIWHLLQNKRNKNMLQTFGQIKEESAYIYMFKFDMPENAASCMCLCKRLTSV